MSMYDEPLTVIIYLYDDALIAFGLQDKWMVLGSDDAKAIAEKYE